MPAQLIDGKLLASQIKLTLAQHIKRQMAKGTRAPGLAVILMGNDPASAIYVRNKHQACAEVGIISENYTLPTNTSHEELVALILQLNQDPKIDGILLQAPLPPHIKAEEIFELIDPQKDVDGFHPYNLGLLAQRRPHLRPCTPYGIMLLLEHINQVFKGKHAVIIGASNIVGRPMAFELLIAGSTVTVCHRFTADLAYFVKQADILVSAVGKANLILGDWIKEGATVVDVGQNRLGDGSITGDVEFAKACQKAKWITPVPGGVGPMTVAMLLQNTLIAGNYI